VKFGVGGRNDATARSRRDVAGQLLRTTTWRRMTPADRGLSLSLTTPFASVTRVVETPAPRMSTVARARGWPSARTRITTTVSCPTITTLCETRIAPAGHGTVGGVSGPVVVVLPVPDVVVVPATPEVLVVPPELVVGPAVVVRFVDVEVEVEVEVEVDLEVEVDVDVDVDVLVLVLVLVEVVPPHSASGRCSPGSAGSLRMKSPECPS
jgi:hypothetical protein